MGSWKITVKFPSNIQRPAEGNECELIVVSIFHCHFLTSAQSLACRNRKGRVGKKKILSDQASSQGRSKSLECMQENDWHDRSHLCWKGRELNTGGGWRVEGQWIGNSNVVRWRVKWEYLSKQAWKFGKLWSETETRRRVTGGRAVSNNDKAQGMTLGVDN